MEVIKTHPQNAVYAREWERIFEPEQWTPFLGEKDCNESNGYRYKRSKKKGGGK